MIADSFRDVSSGVIVGVVTIFYSLSFATLIFAGDLSSGMPYGVNAALIGAAACVLVVGRLSSIRGSTAGPDTPTMAVMAAMAATLSANIAGPGSADGLVLDHVLAAIVVSTICVGVSLWVLGHLRMGQWMRFVPYPVIGGFLTASGWLLTLGAVHVLTGQRPEFQLISDPASVRMLSQLAVGAGFSIVVLLFLRVSRHVLVLPVLMVIGTLGVHLGLTVAGLDAEQARQQNWLISFPVQSAFWDPWRWQTWAGLDPAYLIPQVGELGVAVGVTAMAVLLNATGLEAEQRANADINLELKASGLANLLSGLFGGMIGNLSLNRSRLNIQAGANSSLNSLVVAATCVAFIFFGDRVAPYMATPVLGGLLLVLGLSLLSNWLLRMRKRLSVGDYVLLVSIFLCIVNLGYLEGSLLGMVAASVLFVVRYSRIPVVYQRRTAGTCSSYVDRSRQQRELLDRFGDRILVLQLQGYLFFGTSNTLFEDIRHSMAQMSPGPRVSVVLDFKRVSGIDSSAVFSFAKLHHVASDAGWRLYLSAVPEHVLTVLDSDGLLSAGSHEVSVCESLDYALEQAEELLLAGLTRSSAATRTVDFWLGDELGDRETAGRLKRYLKRCEIEAGEYLCAQGEPSDEMFFVIEGRVSIILRLPDHSSLRLRSLEEQTMIGEMGFFREVSRTTSVMADRRTIFYSLDRASFERMKRDDPDACMFFQNLVIGLLSNRLEFANRELSALQQ